jgi:putative Holliday junction resolvase
MDALRHLAIDHGEAHIGIALSDPLGLFAQPLCTLRNDGTAIVEIVKLLSEHSVGVLVVGVPLELDGCLGPQAKKVERFVKKLEVALQADETFAELKLVYWDERLTSVEAEEIIRGSKLKNRKRRALVDRVAAAVILESYLNSSDRST